MSIDATEPIGQVFYAADGGDDETGAGYYMTPCVHWFGKAPAADTKLYTTPQTAQATQAEVTDGIRPEDFTVDVVVRPMGGFAPVNTQGVRVTHKPTGISVTCDVARSQHANRNQAFEKLCTILTLLPQAVPMTPASRDVIMATRTANADADEWPEPWAYQRGWKNAEAHHGITAQAKKETP